MITDTVADCPDAGVAPDAPSAKSAIENRNSDITSTPHPPMLDTSAFDLVLYYYDAVAAEQAVRFFDLLTHTKGKWAGRPFQLMPWQEKATRDIYGWRRRSDNTRKHRYVWTEVPRKNGKTEWLAGLGLKGFIADYEILDGQPAPLHVADTYSVAKDRSQARITFDTAKMMIQASEYLLSKITVLAHCLEVKSTKAVWRPLSKDSGGIHGLNPAVYLFDEVHTQRDWKHISAMKTATGARSQPLGIFATTAGDDVTSPAYDRHELAVSILRGTLKNDEWYPIVFGAPMEADWTDPAVHRAANPSIGVTIDIKELAAECQSAIDRPIEENDFRRFRLNQWVQQSVRWIPLRDWDLCTAPVDPEALKGRPCYGALDLSASYDFTSFGLIFPEDDGSYTSLTYLWLPAASMKTRIKPDLRPQYELWIRQGHIRLTTGTNTINIASIETDILQIAGDYNIIDIAFDTWQARDITTRLAEEHGLTMVPFVQGLKSYNAPSKKFYELVIEHQFNHGGHPVMRWMADNVVARTDDKQNIMPDRQNSKQKIDGIATAIMALDGAAVRSRHAPDGPSIYETQGVRTV